MDLQGKCVLLGVTGGIAAYKMANVASALKKLGADVEVIMTENATHFITPLVFETLTGHKCMVDTFDRDFNVIDKQYIGDPETIAAKIDAVANQGKAKK